MAEALHEHAHGFCGMHGDERPLAIGGQIGFRKMPVIGVSRRASTILG